MLAGHYAGCLREHFRDLSDGVLQPHLVAVLHLEILVKNLFVAPGV